jgi:hypothetical protein
MSNPPPSVRLMPYVCPVCKQNRNSKLHTDACSREMQERGKGLRFGDLAATGTPSRHLPDPRMWKKQGGGYGRN